MAEHAGAEPDLAGYLDRLGESVLRDLLPLATAGKLAGELRSLSSILRLSARAAASGADDHRAEIADTLATLSDIDTGVGTGPEVSSVGAEPPDADTAGARSRLAVRARALDLGDHAAIRALIGWARRDAGRGAGSFGMPVSPTGPLPTRDPARTLADPDRRPELRDALRDALGRPELSITAVDTTASGFAADTAIVRVSSPGGPDRVVVRAQWPDQLTSSVTSDVARQATAMRCAAEAGLPVPTVLAAVPDPGRLGTPLLLSSFEPGSAPDLWTPDGRARYERIRRPDGIEAFLGALVTLHTRAPWGPLADAAETAIQRLDRRLAHLEEIHRRCELRPDPLVELALRILCEHVAVWGETVLVHGDYRPGNILHDDDGRMTAVIDWDLAGPGDRHEDLATLLSTGHRDRSGRACGLAPDDELLDGYTRLGGREIIPAGLAWYRLFGSLRHVIALQTLVRTWYDRGGSMRAARALYSLGEWRADLVTRLDEVCRR